MLGGVVVSTVISQSSVGGAGKSWSNRPDACAAGAGVLQTLLVVDPPSAQAVLADELNVMHGNSFQSVGYA